MKLYDRVKQLLEQDSSLRNSDKLLIWRIWMDCGYVGFNRIMGHQWINRENFMDANTPESITRARRMVQQDFPHLQATEQIRGIRKSKQEEKGTHVYREIYTGKLF